MMNLRKTAEEINRLRELVNNQKDTIKKAMKVIEQLADDCCRLQAENEKLKERINKLYWHNMQCPTHDPDVIFPNTDERGLGDGDTPGDLSPFDL